MSVLVLTGLIRMPTISMSTCHGGYASAIDFQGVVALIAAETVGFSTFTCRRKAAALRSAPFW